MKKLGVIIIAIGLGLTIFSTITIFTKDRVVDLGAIEISRENPHHLNWSPLIGVAVMAIGGIVLWLNNKK